MILAGMQDGAHMVSMFSLFFSLFKYFWTDMSAAQMFRRFAGSYFSKAALQMEQHPQKGNQKKKRCEEVGKRGSV